MSYGGVLPYAEHKGQLWLLLGKELRIANWSGSEKWSPFGGGVDPGESLETAAVREGYEESMGLLGSQASMRRRGQRWPHQGGLTLLLPLQYDRRLPQYFRQFFNYAKRCRGQTCPEGWYEKTHIKWVPLDRVHTLDLRPEFRRTLRSLRERLRPD
jgi:8-oxo-dGTP pyrophosphatase MutT (NUDIX family)